MNRRLLWLMTSLVVFALVMSGCGGASAPEQPAPAPQEAAPAAEEPAQEEAPAAEEPAQEEAPAAEEQAQEEAPAAEEPAQEEAAADASGVTELTILWAQWDPADYLQEIGNMYEAETGVKINVIQEPWGSFQDLFFTEMSAQGTSYDMVVGDSQWLGQATTQGHYLDMTEFLNSTGIAETVTPATLQYYGEYPPGSGTFWAYPTEGDANGWAYRKDLFENPDEMAAFEAEYGYPLAPPETYEQLLDIAKFFTRPEENLYGAAIYTQADYDGLTMGFQNAFFSFGGNWADENFNVIGVANSPEAVAAAELYKELYDCCQPPGMSNAFFVETNDAFIGGQAAMSMNYFAFFPALVNPEVNPYAADTGFFVNPKGPNGEQYAALGGQGMSIISYVSPERQQAARDFIEWFAKPEIQAEWAALGGYTCNSEVLSSQEFLDITPFNPAFAETMTFVKDFWNIPEFGELLRVAQTELGNYIVGGQGTAQEAMDRMAEQQQQILEDAGYVTE
ncbi:MAG TPA: extracellular solute-binding protein [Anaerolineae bacterium]|nr:extracellular solute-binding protein [Anaerolineae bacterium]HMR62694.1 extracellular solute-binding protein [Anaerolineae bacterium]